MDISANDFIAEFAYLTLSHAMLNTILASHPNYNYLYSNYSTNYIEPINYFIQSAELQNFINYIYGPDMDVSILEKF